MAVVVMREGLRGSFLKRHRKDRTRARHVWEALRERADVLAIDVHHGTWIARDQVPEAFAFYPSLWKLDLPHACRALYTVFARPDDDMTVAIVWVGDHTEYDRLFGYGQTVSATALASSATSSYSTSSTALSQM